MFKHIGSKTEVTNFKSTWEKTLKQKNIDIFLNSIYIEI